MDNINHCEVEGIICDHPIPQQIKTQEGFKDGLRFTIQMMNGPIVQFLTCLYMLADKAQTEVPTFGDLVRIEGQIRQRIKQGVEQSPTNFECYIQCEIIRKAMFKPTRK